MARANLFVSTSITVGRELAEVAEQLRRCTVQVCGPDSGRGSGVIWRPDGLIVTNAHVATSTRHTVQLADGRVCNAKLVRRDPRSDLAVLRVEATELPSAQWRNPSSLRPGALVFAVGNPLEATGAFAMGVVSATPKVGDKFMRADIRLVPGNSGGPLADVDGKVVGINSMIVDGFGVAVTSTAAESFLSGDLQIGVTLGPVAAHVGYMPAFGLVVVELEPGGPAHLSGVLIGDVIVRVQGNWLNSPEQLSDAIHVAKHPISIDVLRAGRLETIEVMPRKGVAEVA